VAASTLTLVLPSLTLDDSEKKLLSEWLAKKEKAFKRLRKVFSRGEKETIDSKAIALANLFTLTYTEAETFPIAAIMAFGAGIDASTGYWMCADPVNLYPDLDHVLLFDKNSFDLAKHELAQLVSEMDEMLLEDGISTHHGHQQSLFFRTTDKSDVVFTPISEVSGKNILQHLPEGEDAAKWRLLQNEMQMHMTQSQINRDREEKGIVPVNGLWLWGGGYLLRAKYKQVFDVVYANNLFGKGLAKITSMNADKLCENIDAIDPAKNNMVVFDVVEDNAAAWGKFLMNIEKQWLQPALALIKKNELDTLTILTGKIKIKFTKQHLSRFWRRSKKANMIVDML